MKIYTTVKLNKREIIEAISEYIICNFGDAEIKEINVLDGDLPLDHLNATISVELHPDQIHSRDWRDESELNR